MPTKTIIQNGRVIDPQNNVDTVTDLVLVDGKVASIGKVDDTTDATVID
ncbi:MAG TPA: dihydroorotase, partial [Phycisphaerales bacterium]|nr:dihydroorotase [Phycisphaerales bacterium]